MFWLRLMKMRHEELRRDVRSDSLESPRDEVEVADDLLLPPQTARGQMEGNGNPTCQGDVLTVKVGKESRQTALEPISHGAENLIPSSRPPPSSACVSAAVRTNWIIVLRIAPRGSRATEA